MTAPSIPNGSISNSETADVTKLTANDNALLDAMTDGTKALTVESITATNLTASGLIKSADGSASAPGVSFTSDTNTGIYRIGADNIGIATAGTKAVDIDANGIITTPLQSGVYASGSSTTIDNNTLTTIVFSTEGYDIASEYDNTTGIFTASVAGIYQINTSVAVDGGALAKFCYINILKNDTTLLSSAALTWADGVGGVLDAYMGSCSCCINLNATDTICVKAYQNNGLTLSVTSAASVYKTHLSIAKIA